MRIVITEFISLDGVVQAPGGPQEDTDGGFAHGGWSHPYFDEEVLGGTFDEGLARADALLFGRRTYQTMAGAWPERAGDPFADRMNSLKKYVVSSTLGEADLTWNNSSLIPGDRAVARIRELHEAEGGRDRHDGQPDPGADAAVGGSGRRTPARRDAGDPRRRQDDLPRRRREAPDGTGLHSHR